jgi:hypothetical protein
MFFSLRAFGRQFLPETNTKTLTKNLIVDNHGEFVNPGQFLGHLNGLKSLSVTLSVTINNTFSNLC